MTKRSQGLLAIFVFAIAILAGCSSGGDSGSSGNTSNGPVLPKETVVSAKAERNIAISLTAPMSSFLENASVSLPANALDEGEAIGIAIAEVRNLDTTAFSRIGPSVRYFAIDNQNQPRKGFNNNAFATIEVPFSQTALDAQIQADSDGELLLIRMNDDGSEPTSIAFELGNGVLRAQSAHFSDFFVVYRRRSQRATQISSLSMNSGSIHGGQDITISGRGFIGPLSVLIDGLLAGAPSDAPQGVKGPWIVDSQTIRCSTPFGNHIGSVDVRVSTPVGSDVLEDAFLYQGDNGDFPPPTFAEIIPAEGILSGSPFTIRGSGFANSTISVEFGGVPANEVFIVNDTTIFGIAPPKTVSGAVSVRITSDHGSVLRNSIYTYGASPPEGVQPRVLSMIPADSPLAGTDFTMRGSGFSNGPLSISIGGEAATNLTVINDTTLIASAPAKTVSGVASVVVTNNSGSVLYPEGMSYSSIGAQTYRLADYFPLDSGTSLQYTNGWKAQSGHATQIGGSNSHACWLQADTDAADAALSRRFYSREIGGPLYLHGHDTESDTLAAGGRKYESSLPLLPSIFLPLTMTEGQQFQSSLSGGNLREVDVAAMSDSATAFSSETFQLRLVSTGELVLPIGTLPDVLAFEYRTFDESQNAFPAAPDFTFWLARDIGIVKWEDSDNPSADRELVSAQIGGTPLRLNVNPNDINMSAYWPLVEGDSYTFSDSIQRDVAHDAMQDGLALFDWDFGAAGIAALSRSVNGGLMLSSITGARLLNTDSLALEAPSTIMPSSMVDGEILHIGHFPTLSISGGDRYRAIGEMMVRLQSVAPQVVPAGTFNDVMRLSLRFQSGVVDDLQNAGELAPSNQELLIYLARDVGPIRYEVYENDDLVIRESLLFATVNSVAIGTDTRVSMSDYLMPFDGGVWRHSDGSGFAQVATAPPATGVASLRRTISHAGVFSMGEAPRSQSYDYSADGMMMTRVIPNTQAFPNAADTSLWPAEQLLWVPAMSTSVTRRIMSAKWNTAQNPGVPSLLTVQLSYELTPSLSTSFGAFSDILRVSYLVGALAVDEYYARGIGLIRLVENASTSDFQPMRVGDPNIVEDDPDSYLELMAGNQWQSANGVSYSVSSDTVAGITGGPYTLLRREVAGNTTIEVLNATASGWMHLGRYTEIGGTPDLLDVYDSPYLWAPNPSVNNGSFDVSVSGNRFQYPDTVNPVNVFNETWAQRAIFVGSFETSYGTFSSVMAISIERGDSLTISYYGEDAGLIRVATLDKSNGGWTIEDTAVATVNGAPLIPAQVAINPYIQFTSGHRWHSASATWFGAFAFNAGNGVSSLNIVDDPQAFSGRNLFRRYTTSSAGWHITSLAESSLVAGTVASTDITFDSGDNLWIPLRVANGEMRTISVIDNDTQLPLDITITYDFLPTLVTGDETLNDLLRISYSIKGFDYEEHYARGRGIVRWDRDQVAGAAEDLQINFVASSTSAIATSDANVASYMLWDVGNSWTLNSGAVYSVGTGNLSAPVANGPHRIFQILENGEVESEAFVFDAQTGLSSLGYENTLEVASNDHIVERYHIPALVAPASASHGDSLGISAGFNRYVAPDFANADSAGTWDATRAFLFFEHMATTTQVFSDVLAIQESDSSGDLIRVQYYAAGIGLIRDARWNPFLSRWELADTTSATVGGMAVIP